MPDPAPCMEPSVCSSPTSGYPGVCGLHVPFLIPLSGGGEQRRSPCPHPSGPPSGHLAFYTHLSVLPESQERDLKGSRGLGPASYGCGFVLCEEPASRKLGISCPCRQAWVGNAVSSWLCTVKHPSTTQLRLSCSSFPSRERGCKRRQGWRGPGAQPCRNGAGGGGGAAERAADLLNYDFNAVTLITRCSSNHQMQFMAKQAPKHFSFYED